MTKQDRLEFTLFCQNATALQLVEIAAKERKAGRIAYAEIALLVASAKL